MLLDCLFCPIINIEQSIQNISNKSNLQILSLSNIHQLLSTIIDKNTIIIGNGIITDLKLLKLSHK